MRDALKENGIGRPSTRAAIIETLFKRRYIRKERKSLVATPTGVELIGIIREELLKSAELTGLWEKKLRQIERHDYSAQQFIDELKQMVTDLINTVRADNSNRRITIMEEEVKGKKKKETAATTSNAPAGFQPRKKKAATTPRATQPSPAASPANPSAADQWVGLPCPVCHEGHIIKGKTAYGCSRWKEGCTYRRPFDEPQN